MTRQELGKAIRDCRISSGKKAMDICLALQCLPQTFYRIEGAKYNYSMDTAINLLKVLGYKLHVKGPNTQIAITVYTKLLDWFVAERKAQECRQIAFAKDIGYTPAQLGFVEKGKSIMTVDMFLKAADLFGVEISIIKNKNK